MYKDSVHVRLSSQHLRVFVTEDLSVFDYFN